MKGFILDIADEAWTEIERQIPFISVDRQAPMNAARWSNRLLEGIDGLELMPRWHTFDSQQTRELGTSIYRMVFEANYLFFHSLDEVEETRDDRLLPAWCP